MKEWKDMSDEEKEQDLVQILEHIKIANELNVRFEKLTQGWLERLKKSIKSKK
jgi:hypothetical protein